MTPDGMRTYTHRQPLDECQSSVLHACVAWCICGASHRHAKKLRRHSTWMPVNHAMARWHSANLMAFGWPWKCCCKWRFCATSYTKHRERMIWVTRCWYTEPVERIRCACSLTLSLFLCVCTQFHSTKNWQSTSVCQCMVHGVLAARCRITYYCTRPCTYWHRKYRAPKPRKHICYVERYRHR